MSPDAGLISHHQRQLQSRIETLRDTAGYRVYERIRERVLAGLQRAKAQGKRLGRPKISPPAERLATVAQMSLTNAAAALGISRATVKRWRRAQKSLQSVA